MVFVQRGMAPATKAAMRPVAAIPVRALFWDAHTLALRIWPAMPPKTRSSVRLQREAEGSEGGGILGYWGLVAAGGRADWSTSEAGTVAGTNVGAAKLESDCRGFNTVSH